MLLVALILSIPAFYLVLIEIQHSYHFAGNWLYSVVAALLAVDIFIKRDRKNPGSVDGIFIIDFFIFLGVLASIWPVEGPWNSAGWLWRLALCCIVFFRLATLLANYIVPNSLPQIVVLAVLVLGVAGAGFFWLEPRVQTYADGVWLAFTTGATVGYGDLVPSTPASRIFAAFVVLLGYALFSVVTASVAAILVGEDENRIRRELHADMRMLRAEITALRAELRDAVSTRNSEVGANQNKK